MGAGICLRERLVEVEVSPRATLPEDADAVGAEKSEGKSSSTRNRSV